MIPNDYTTPANITVDATNLPSFPEGSCVVIGILGKLQPYVGQVTAVNGKRLLGTVLS